MASLVALHNYLRAYMGLITFRISAAVGVTKLPFI
jgi:hypothetical protein